MQDRGFLERLLARTTSRGGDYADLFLEDSRRSMVRLDDGKIEAVSAGVEVGIGLRLVSGDSSAYSYTNDLNEARLLDVASELSRALASAPAGSSIVLGQAEEKSVQPQQSAEAVAPADKADVVWRADRAARALGPEIRQVSVGYVDQRRRLTVANSLGEWREQDIPFIRLIVQVVAQRGQVLQSSLEAPALQAGFEFFEEYPPETVAETAARRVVTMLGADQAPTGPMPVVLAQGSGGVLFHEASGHGLEADIVHKGSVYQGKLGEIVGSPSVTLLDDPTLAGAWGSYAFDDEGTPAQRTVLIEQGKLVSFLCDRLGGKKLGLASTGNGRREDYSAPPIARMSNTYLAPGALAPEEVIASVTSGLYAKKLGGGEVSPETGEFVFSVTEGYLIEKGEITRPVRGATLVGNGPSVLRTVQLVADDLKRDPGTCGKEGQGVPVTTGTPTLSISEMTVGGTGGSHA